MKITAQEEYGLRCILQLASQPTGEPLTVGEIARREGLSVAYVEKLLRILGKAGLTSSARGINGGYTLSRPCEEMTLGDVGRALGGVPISQDICTRYTGNLENCIHEESCGILPVWENITQYVQGVMDGITVSQLLHKRHFTHLSAENRGSVSP